MRIDSLCDVYDRMILVSGDLFNLFSTAGKDICRKIDTITMVETPNAFKDIYSVDMTQSEPIIVTEEQVADPVAAEP